MRNFVIHHLQPGLDKNASWPAREEETEQFIRNAMISGEVSGALEKGLYQPIAVVRCASVDEVFPITNHIDHDWTTNEQVVKCDGRQRSTSVGDIAVDCETGIAWACRSVGWDEIADPHHVGLLRDTSQAFASSPTEASASPR